LRLLRRQTSRNDIFMYIPKERKLRTVKDIKGLKGKRVLVRVDALHSQKIPRQARNDRWGPGEGAIVTIRYLIRKRARVIILSNDSKKWYEFLKSEIKEKVNFFYLNKLLGIQVLRKLGELKNGDILVTVDLRDYIGEQMNSPKFARELARLGDMYVNDAPQATNQLSASVSWLPQLLPGYAGMNLVKPVKKKVTENLISNIKLLME
jgi:phosphoglycerate kinase